MNQNQLLIVILVIAVIAVAAVAFAVMRQRRRQKLRERFGPEDDRVVRREGDVGKGEAVLEFREKRREKFKLRPLSPTDKSSFGHRWNEVQSRFVDDPKGAVTVADSLVMDVMQARGYPMFVFDQRAADISVDYTVFVENYLAAFDIAIRHNFVHAGCEALLYRYR